MGKAQDKDFFDSSHRT